MSDRLRIGVIGLRFGSQVHVPAFRSDARCEVVALAGRNGERAAAMARDLAVPSSFPDWRSLVASPDIDAVSVAVPPAAQPAIVAEAAGHRKHVFCEKPLAASVAEAEHALKSVDAAGIVHAIDFIFPEITAWQQAKTLLGQGVIGRPKHFAYTWRVETYASRTNANTWKNCQDQGGGVLGNFVSHVFYNIGWLLGEIRSIDTFAFPPGSRAGRAADGAVQLDHGLEGRLSVSADAFLGSGHIVEVYGDEGTLVLQNSSSDYVAGFRLSIGTRASGVLAAVRDDVNRQPEVDGRIAPVSELARRFVDAIHGGSAMTPNFVDGLRVQKLLERAEIAARHASRAGESRAATSR